jgi:sulfur-oxidizing protein SoxY
MMPRRAVLGAGLALAVAVRPARATPEALRDALHAFSAGAPLRDGRVELEIETLVENGNTVPVVLRALAPPEAVRRLALFTERNPEPEVAVFHLSAAGGRAEVATRIRLATSQQVVAVAHFADGSYGQARADVLVTLAACIEE